MQLYLHPPVLCSTVYQLDQHTWCHHKFCKRQIGGQSLLFITHFLTHHSSCCQQSILPLFPQYIPCPHQCWNNFPHPPHLWFKQCKCPGLAITTSINHLTLCIALQAASVVRVPVAEPLLHTTVADVVPIVDAGSSPGLTRLLSKSSRRRQDEEGYKQLHFLALSNLRLTARVIVKVQRTFSPRFHLLQPCT